VLHVLFYIPDRIEPTPDRVDNSKGHSLDDVEAYCLYCTGVKFDKDKGIVQFKIQLRKHFIMDNLPITLSDEVTYHILRDGIIGGSSNVEHCFNIARDGSYQ
jgi:hypothetical protein